MSGYDGPPPPPPPSPPPGESQKKLDKGRMPLWSSGRGGASERRAAAALELVQL